MSCEIHFRGGSVEVAEKYNLIRQRVNRAMRDQILAKNGEPILNTKDKVVEYEPAHLMSFTTVDEDGDPTGRVSININEYICVTSDDLKDESNSGETD